MQTTQDPYNYPFLKKDETMYLSTISNPLFIQLKMISSLHFLSTIDNPPSKRRTFREPILKFLSRISPMIQVSVCQHLSSRCLEPELSIKLRTHCIMGTLKAPTRSLINLGQKELWTHFALCISFPLLQKLALILVKISSEIL